SGRQQGRGARGAALGRADPRRSEARATSEPERRDGPDRAPAGGAPGARAACAKPVAPLPTAAHVCLCFGKLLLERTLPYSRTADGCTAFALLGDRPRCRSA